MDDRRPAAGGNKRRGCWVGRQGDPSLPPDPPTAAGSGTAVVRRWCVSRRQARSLRADAVRSGARPRERPLAGPSSLGRPPHAVGTDRILGGGPISAEPRINDQIRAPERRLVGPEGQQVGILPVAQALKLAEDTDLDLVEVAPMARPPVCQLMDYGKFKYESAQKAREARRNQALTVIKEMKLRPKIDPP